MLQKIVVCECPASESVLSGPIVQGNMPIYVDIGQPSSDCACAELHRGQTHDDFEAPGHAFGTNVLQRKLRR